MRVFGVGLVLAGLLVGLVVAPGFSAHAAPPVKTIRAGDDVTPPANSVLELSGQGAYVELPPGIFSGMKEATIEGWFKWNSFPFYSQPLCFGDAQNCFGINNSEIMPKVRAFIYREGKPNIFNSLFIPNPGEWTHMAVAAGTNGMKLFINGTLAGASPFSQGLTGLGANSTRYFGKSVYQENADFVGQMDEIRVWNTARTEEEIRATLFRKLSGTETGLEALWNFDGQDRGGDQQALDHGAHHYNGWLRGGARVVRQTLPIEGELPLPARVHGRVEDKTGQGAQSQVILEMAGGRWLSMPTTPEGDFSFSFAPGDGLFEIGAEANQFAASPLRFAIKPGEQMRLALILGDGTRVAGQTKTFDGVAAGGVTIEAVPVGFSKSAANSLVMRKALLTKTDSSGRFEFLNLPPGSWRFRNSAYARDFWHKPPSGRAASEDREGGVVVLKVGSKIENVDIQVGAPSRGLWKSYRTEDGLPEGDVLALETDSEGRLWVGTDQGMARFDGRQFESFGIPGPAHVSVRALKRGGKGTMWIGCSAGLLYFNGHAVVSVGQNGESQKGHTSILSLDMPDSRTLWAGTMAGAARYELRDPPGTAVVERRLTVEDGLLSNAVHSLKQDENGLLWLGTENGLSAFDGKSVTNYFGLAQFQIWNVGHFGRNENGEPLFGSPNGLAHFSGGHPRWLASDNRGKDFSFHSSVAAHDGSLWFSSEAGVGRILNGRLCRFNVRDGLASDLAFTLHAAADGRVWVGTKEGLSCFDPNGPVSFTVADGMPNAPVHAIAADGKGDHWFATEAGVSRLADGEIKSFTPADGLQAADTRSILSGKDGSIWFGHFLGGLSRWKGGALRGFTQNRVYGMAQNEQGVLYLAGSDGIWTFDGQEFSNASLSHGHRPYSGTSALWTPQGVLCSQVNDGFTRWNASEVEHFPYQESFKPRWICSMALAPDGGVWCGTADGALHWRTNRAEWIKPGDGLPRSLVEAVLYHPDHQLWFGTKAGLSIFDGALWSLIDSKNGLAGDEVWGLWQDPEGSTWIGTDKGATRYRRSPNKPSLTLIAVEAERRHTNLAALPPIRVGTRVSFEMRSQDFRTPPERQQFYCRIFSGAGAGFADDLAEKRRGLLQFSSDKAPGATSAAQASRPLLTQVIRAPVFAWRPEKPGTYEFVAQAADCDLNYSDPVRARIVVQPFWYADARIILPLGLAFFGLLGTTGFLGNRYYRKNREMGALSRSMEAREAERKLSEAFSRRLIAALEEQSKRISGELHDSLGQNLLIIKTRASLAAGGSNVEEMKGSLAELSRLTGAAIDEARGLAYGLRPYHLDRIGLSKALEEMVLALGNSAGFAVELDLAPLEAKFAPDVEINLYRAVQEILNNIIKHADAASVKASLRREGAGIVVKIEDDGRGFDPEVLRRSESGPQGFGLVNLRERIKIMGGELDIASQPSVGTRVTIRVPLEG